MKLKPLYEKIALIIDDKQEIVSETGLHYVKNMSVSSNTTMIGKVVAVGDGRLLADGTLIPLKVKVGDRVIYSKMQGESYTDGKCDYVFLSEHNIIAILGEDDNGNN